MLEICTAAVWMKFRGRVICPITMVRSHWLGSCSQPHLTSAYISRHNRALCLLQHTLSTSSPTAWYTIMDATSSSRLPPSVSATRIPSWLLPSVPPATLSKLRPDILILKGLSITTYFTLSSLLLAHDTYTLSTLKSSCTVHIIELS